MSAEEIAPAPGPSRRPHVTPGPEPGAAPPGPPPAELAALVHEHYARLCDFAHRYVRSRAAAEDIVQDVFVAVLARGSAFAYADPLPYLYQATRHRALSHLRKVRVRERHGRAAAIGAPATRSAPPAAERVERDELARALDAAIDALPERCRLVFTLSRVQELTYAEIARALDISVKTVETQMGRALRTLRTRLAPYLSIAAASLAALDRAAPPC